MNQASGFGQLPIAYYFTVLRRQWRTIAGFAAVLFAAVLVISTTSTRIYSATCTIEIQEDAPVVLSNVTDVLPQTPMWHLDQFYRTQHWLVASRQVMQAAVEDLRERHGETAFNDTPDPAGALRGMVSVNPKNMTHLVQIAVEHPNPEKAALYANAVAEAYARTNLDHRLEASRAALDWLETQQGIYRQRRYASDRELLSYQTEKGVFQVDQQAVTTETLLRLQAAWSKAHTDRVAMESRTRSMRRQLARNDIQALADHIATSGDVTSDILVLFRLKQQERAALLARLTPKHPDVLQADRELSAIEVQLKERVEDYIEGQEAGVTLVLAEEQALADAIERIGAAMAEQAEEMLPLQFLEQQSRRDAQFYENLDLRRTEVGLQQLLQANNVRIVDRARPNASPVRPKVMLNLLTAALAGVLGGALLAIGLELTDATVKTREDVETASGAPLLGFVPLVGTAQLAAIPREVDRHLFAYTMPRSPMAECLRTVRTNLLFRGQRATGQRRLMITSASPREGKSFLTANLAAVVASSGGRVLCIDADLRRPSLHTRFGLSNEIGLADVLTNTVSLEQAIQPTHVPGVHVLVAGRCPEKPLEMLGDQRMQQLIDSTKAYETVMIDTPPVNVVSDALLIGSLVDGVIFIVNANKTPKSLVAACCTRLQEVNQNLLGSIVNKLDVSNAGYGYNYYYSEYYQYYQPTQPRRAAGKER